MTEKTASEKTDGMQALISVVMSFFVSSLLLLYYHDLFWYAPDEGVFAHMADRVNAGQIYGVDFNGLQPGYHALLNAYLFEHLGRDLVVLRYPILVMGCIQAMMVTYMLRSYGVFISVFGALWITVFGFLQFLNPSPNWYCSFLTLVVIFLLTEFPRKSLAYILVGLCVGISTGIRHPSGVFLALGVLGFVLYDLRSVVLRPLGEVWISRLLTAVIILALGIYCALINHEYSAVFYIGIWPVILMAGLLYRYGVANVDLIRPLLLLSLGGLIGIAPLFLYQIIYGDVQIWFNTSILGVLQQLELPHYKEVAYHQYPLMSWQGFLGLGGVYALFVSLYWTVAYLSVPALMFYMVRSAWRDNGSVPALAIVTSFYAYVMLYFQIPIYFYYAFGFFGIYALMICRSGAPRFFALLCMSCLMGVSLLSYIAKPYEDASENMADSSLSLPGVSLEITEDSAMKYTKILDVIEQRTQEDEPIFVFPTNAELYYLSRRPNPTPYTVTSNAIYDEQSYARLFEMIKAAKPKLIFTREEDKYFYIYEQRLLDDLIEKLGYTRAAPIGDFTVLQLMP